MLTLRKLEIDEPRIRVDIDPAVMDACNIDDGTPVRLTDWRGYGGYSKAYRGYERDRNTGYIRVPPKLCDHCDWVEGVEIRVETDYDVIHERKPKNHIETSDTIQTPFGEMDRVTKPDDIESDIDGLQWLTTQNECQTSFDCPNCIGTMHCRIEEDTKIAFLCEDCDSCIYENRISRKQTEDSEIENHASHYLYDHH